MRKHKRLKNQRDCRDVNSKQLDHFLEGLKPAQETYRNKMKLILENFDQDIDDNAEKDAVREYLKGKQKVSIKQLQKDFPNLDADHLGSILVEVGGDVEFTESPIHPSSPDHPDNKNKYARERRKQVLDRRDPSRLKNKPKNEEIDPGALDDDEVGAMSAELGDDVEGDEEMVGDTMDMDSMSLSDKLAKVDELLNAVRTEVEGGEDNTDFDDIEGDEVDELGDEDDLGGEDDEVEVEIDDEEGMDESEDDIQITGGADGDVDDEGGEMDELGDDELGDEIGDEDLGGEDMEGDDIEVELDDGEGEEGGEIADVPEEVISTVEELDSAINDLKAKLGITDDEGLEDDELEGDELGDEDLGGEDMEGDSDDITVEFDDEDDDMGGEELDADDDDVEEIEEEADLGPGQVAKEKVVGNARDVKELEDK